MANATYYNSLVSKKDSRSRRLLKLDYRDIGINARLKIGVEPKLDLFIIS